MSIEADYAQLADEPDKPAQAVAVAVRAPAGVSPAEWAAYVDASAIEPPAAHYRRPPPRRCCTSRRCCYACVALLGALAAATVASIFLITRSPWVKVAQDGVEFAPDGASVSRLRVRLHNQNPYATAWEDLRVTLFVHNGNAAQAANASAYQPVARFRGHGRTTTAKAGAGGDVAAAWLAYEEGSQQAPGFAQLAQRCAGHGTAVLRVKGEVHAKGKATVHTTMHKKTIDCHVNRTAAPTPAPSALVS